MRVLVVEDAEATRRRISALLRANGYDVEEAADGLKALKAVSAEHFDAIVLDLLLPNVDGWQFRETQLRHPELASIPTVVVTVYPLREPDRYVLRTQNVVRKPFEDDELLSIVKQACAAPPAAAHRAPAPRRAISTLYWSRHGKIACAEHAPLVGSPEWNDEHWAPIPPNPGYQQIVYQCQYCPGHKGPIQRRTRS
jgi:CheY-like chemotaxis protein